MWGGVRGSFYSQGKHAKWESQFTPYDAVHIPAHTNSSFQLNTFLVRLGSNWTKGDKYSALSQVHRNKPKPVFENSSHDNKKNRIPSLNLVFTHLGYTRIWVFSSLIFWVSLKLYSIVNWFWCLLRFQSMLESCPFELLCFLSILLCFLGDFI